MKLFGRCLLSTAAIATVPFLAGNPRDPWLWAFIIGLVSIGGYAIYSMDDDLARERFSPPEKGADRLSLRAVRLVALGALIAAILDIRFGWTRVASPLRALGLATFLLSFMLIVRAMRTNRFFSAVVRIQTDRGHRVVDKGPVRSRSASGLRRDDHRGADERPCARLLDRRGRGAGVFGPHPAACGVRGWFSAGTSARLRELRGACAAQAHPGSVVTLRLALPAQGRACGLTNLRPSTCQPPSRTMRTASG
jgi:hypothetical protein